MGERGQVAVTGPHMAAGAGARPVKRRSSIVDVARLAGVSKQTVSNVLNRRNGYTPETGARVAAAMEALGYQPNRSARSLRSQRTMQLGYHMYSAQLEAHTGFNFNFLQALVAACAERGYYVVVFTDVEGDPLRGFHDLVDTRNVDGFILSDSRLADTRARLLAERRVPFASFGRVADDLPQQWVDVDNLAATAAVVDLLAASGHDRIAYVGESVPHYWNRERLEGFRSGMARNGLRVPPSGVLEGTLEDVRPQVRRLLRRARRPSAFVVGNDALAAGLINTVAAAGLVVGRDVAITGFGGGPIGRVTEPNLTTVRIPVEQVARAVVDRCLREISEGPTGAPGEFVPTILDRRGSA